MYTSWEVPSPAGFSVEDTYKPTAVVENLPDSLSPTLSQALDLQEEAEPMDLVRDQELDLYIRFPANFDADGGGVRHVLRGNCSSSRSVL